MFFRRTHAKFLCAGLVLFVVASTVKSQTNKVKMAFIGNSITQGVYDKGKSDKQVSYVAQFNKLMEKVYGDTLEVLNAGVSGRTLTKHGPAPIWREPVFKEALEFVPDICLIALGTNDSKPGLYDLVENEFYNDYQAMIDTFRSVNPKITFIACLPPPIWEGHPYSASDPHNDTLLANHTIPFINAVAKANDIYVVDFHTSFEGELQYFTDHLHPNKEGHKKMAKVLFDWILEKDLIRKKIKSQ